MTYLGCLFLVLIKSSSEEGAKLTRDCDLRREYDVKLKMTIWQIATLGFD